MSDATTDLTHSESKPNGDGADEPLPNELTATLAFVRRLPAQRVIDQLRKLEPDMDFGELSTQQPSRVLAFRMLLRMYPLRDMTSLWMHAYDVEVELEEADPTSAPAPTPSPPSAPTTT
jgi:hypothetical protein